MPATSLPLALLLLAAAAAAAPVRYDQRQEGDFNVHAHLENFVVVLIPTAGSGGGGLGIVDLLKKAGASVRTAEQPLQVAVVKVRPEDQQQQKETPQSQPQPHQREAEEDLVPAAAEAVEAVLVAESPALVLGKTGGAQQGMEAAVVEEARPQVVKRAPPGEDPQRVGRAMEQDSRTCPQGQFRDATGVCHYIGSDQNVGNDFFIGLAPPFQK